MHRITSLPLAVSAVFVALSVSGCTAPTHDADAERTVSALVATPPPAPTASGAPTAPSPTPTHPVDPRDTAYSAEVAAWVDELPPGFAWPESITSLPAGRWHGKGDWSNYLTADGIYHCMLVFAAWNAYFVSNDAAASREYAARADATYPTARDERYPHWLIRENGTIHDQELASQSGVCNGFVGDLSP